MGRRCKAHGLRKAAARRLAEAGCSASEIAAITGHKALAEVERYTRAADQERLARQAIQRQSENQSGKPPDSEVANSTDEALEINSLAWKMALPRETGNSNKINGLVAGANRYISNIPFSVRCRHAPGPSGPMM
ncbi:MULTISPECIES: tyrosine-type recombinase/integrase [unclassified Bradyrhizobium]|uniref:tyrosine-type recombinase/integrase n=1 Tax=unclassified Bradyrhizobium TaxID=2631580 RepID=UPI0028E1F3AB|nr:MULTISPECIES: tyrosine-type recombinase/integrase [unclassified Bradyrhizobium]